MPDSSRIRSFIAIDLDPSVLAALGAVQVELASTRADVRWVRPTGMHVTLKFLGSVDAAHLEGVHAAVCDAISDQPAFHLHTRGLGAFPSLRRPRVIWAGLSSDALPRVVACVERAVESLGFLGEKRPFTAHVTLGRVNTWRGWPQLEEVLKVHLDDEYGTSVVDNVIIYRSTLQPQGAVYAPLWTIPLARNKKEPTDDSGR